MGYVCVYMQKMELHEIVSVPNVPGNNSIARFAKNQGGVVQSWVKISKKGF